MSRTRVVVTGMEAISALGHSPEELWQGLIQSHSGIRRIPRSAQIALAAAIQAIQNAELPEILPEPERSGV